jgi:(S)-ureidoglycine aminohydrolase
MYPKLGLTRNILRRNYALITPDGYVPSVLPGWSHSTAFVIISAAMGARVTQIIIDLEEGGTGSGDTGAEEYFFYIVAGQAACNGNELSTGGYAFVPANKYFEFTGTKSGTRVLMFRQTFEPFSGVAQLPEFLVGREEDTEEVPFLGDPRARLKTLLPDHPGMDMAVNVFTYDPGATLPFVETHIMEHGILFLEGGGVYRLDEGWHPVQAGDSLWIAPYCPQWFIAAGPPVARYIYYKNVNRMP